MKHASFFLISYFIFSSFVALGQINNPRNLPFEWQTDTLNAKIDLDELTMVLPRHSFQTLDFPDFLKKEDGLKSFYIHEPVIAIEINGKAKAYPLNMLTMHEMANDSLGGMAILPTYCPLCNSSLVFNRTVDWKNEIRLLHFEVSGMLRHSDMVMGDKESETWWQQLSGEGIVGEMAGYQLEVLPSQVISVFEFFESYPEGLILSPKTGLKAEDKYGKNPYEHYDASDGSPYARFFDHNNIDNRLPPMERIVNIRSLLKHKVYPQSIIAHNGVINDHFDGLDIVLFHSENTVSVLDEKEIKASKAIGSVTAFNAKINNEALIFDKINDSFYDTKTQSEWDITGKCINGFYEGKKLEKLTYSNHFAFAWLNFHPESEIYKAK